MQLENKFTIAAPIEEAWAALNNPETVAPCFPGATLESYENDSFTGTVKVKLGPISLTYKGKGTYVERDDAAHKVIIDASGRDARGNGTANAKVTGTMKADGPDKTEVTMVTDMTITGRPAQFGRGVISDVSDKIIGQFASCLADKLAPTAKVEEAAAPAEAAGRTNGATTAAKPVAAAPSGPLRSEVEAIDLLESAGAPVLKRLAPVIGGALVLLIIFLIRRSKSN
ncbi:SRPBCC family protein [Pseudonocardia acidicola]|uniref:SRPBCC family protein n=1 Tax=Pseudonocardia acidicola TaxID=2724939 RepID=A0ABX1S928_9PSEU|nr:SRPBCC family protein [Pseudonocardia acidicola]NMH98064.1 SRPBCC family protein [Pseudonocardia acidicola]